MNMVADKIAKELLQKDELKLISKAQLGDLVKDYPYFSLARYLLAAKAVESTDPEAESILSSSVLYFNNPLWFEHIVNPLQEKAVEKIEAIDEPIVEVNEETIVEGNEEPIVEGNEAPVIEGNAEPMVEENVQPMVAGNEEPIVGGNDEPIVMGTDENTEREGKKELNPRENPALASALEAIKVEAFRETTETNPLQPYYAVDYFASQGIKLTGEPKDKLGKQLKSFTEWLKTMKKIPAADADDFDDAANQNIQNIAAHSNDAGEVITEAMAEVLVKQDKPDKAIEVYRKLSLQNPAKSRYFASKIDHLINKI